MIIIFGIFVIGTFETVCAEEANSDMRDSVATVFVDDEEKNFDDIVIAWNYTVYRACEDTSKTVKIRLHSDWYGFSEDGEKTYNGKEYGYLKGDMSCNLVINDIDAISNDSGDKIQAKSFRGAINIPSDCKICIDLNGYVINRNHEDYQPLDGELIYVNGGAKLDIIDSNVRQKNVLADSTEQYGGTLMGGSSGNGGGCIHIKPNAEVSIEKCCIYGNNTDKHGGAIHVCKGASLKIKGTRFRGNRTEDSWDECNGGAIHNDGGKVEISDAFFIRNQSEDSGGAIYNNKGSLKVDNCVFEDCYSSDDGGAIYLKGGTAEIADSKFSENIAENSGGAIYIFTKNVRLVNIIVDGNKAGENGGGIVARDKNIIFDSIEVKNNISAKNGAGVYISNRNYVKMVGNNVIDYNLKNGRGNNIFYENSVVNYDRVFSNKNVTNMIIAFIVFAIVSVIVISFALKKQHSQED